VNYITAEQSGLALLQLILLSTILASISFLFLSLLLFLIFLISSFVFVVSFVDVCFVPA
jgi:hypothetical protein